MPSDKSVKVLNRRTFYKGDVIFHEGDDGAVAYVLQQGRVRITRKTETGEQATLGFVEEGGVFGEMALIDKSPRMASAVADGAVVCIAIPEETVRAKLKATDPVLRTLILMLIRMIRTMADKTPLPPDDLKALAAAAEAEAHAAAVAAEKGEAS